MLRILAERRGRPFRNERCHLFHLFYQMQIRLGSPRSSLCCFRCFLQPNNSHFYTPSAHPAPRTGAFTKFMRRKHCGNFIVADSAARVPAGAAAFTSAKCGRDREFCRWACVAD
jgi:hypothetical protein